MSITTLPDLCLLAIFRHVPLRQFLQLDQVCQRWRTLQPVAALQRKSIYIHITPEAEKDAFDLRIKKAFFLHRFVGSEPDKLVLTGVQFILNYKDYKLLEDVFQSLPNVETVTIVLDTVPIVYATAVLTLLHKWFPNLATLRFCINFLPKYSELIDEAIRESLKKISDFKSLKRFTFENGDSLWTIGPKSFDIPILGQLEQFEFKTFHSLADLFESLEEYVAPNQNLRHIVIGNSIYADDLPRLFRTNICHRLNHLHLNARKPIPKPVLNQFYHHFAGSLTSLTLETSSEENVNFFSKLPNVQNFKL